LAFDLPIPKINTTKNVDTPNKNQLLKRFTISVNDFLKAQFAYNRSRFHEIFLFRWRSVILILTHAASAYTYIKNYRYRKVIGIKILTHIDRSSEKLIEVVRNCFLNCSVLHLIIVL